MLCGGIALIEVGPGNNTYNLRAKIITHITRIVWCIKLYWHQLLLMWNHDIKSYVSSWNDTERFVEMSCHKLHTLSSFAMRFSEISSKWVLATVQTAIVHIYIYLYVYIYIHTYIYIYITIRLVSSSSDRKVAGWTSPAKQLYIIVCCETSDCSNATWSDVYVCLWRAGTCYKDTNCTPCQHSPWSSRWPCRRGSWQQPE